MSLESHSAMCVFSVNVFVKLARLFLPEIITSPYFLTQKCESLLDNFSNYYNLLRQ